MKDFGFEPESKSLNPSFTGTGSLTAVRCPSCEEKQGLNPSFTGTGSLTPERMFVSSDSEAVLILLSLELAR